MTNKPEQRTVGVRWDGDQRGTGVSGGARLLPAVTGLIEVLSLPDWVAEDPEAHLLPHLRDACARPDSPWELAGVEDRIDEYVVRVRRRRPGRHLAEIRSDVFALLGAVAETTTFVRQRRDGDSLAFEVATGMVEEDGPFLPHGHLLRLVIEEYAGGHAEPPVTPGDAEGPP